MIQLHAVVSDSIKSYAFCLKYARSLLFVAQICSKIPNFWLNTLLNHSELQEYINTSDYDCLRHLKILDVQVRPELNPFGAQRIVRLAPRGNFSGQLCPRVSAVHRRIFPLRTEVFWDGGGL
jgi:hypothetical protein